MICTQKNRTNPKRNGVRGFDTDTIWAFVNQMAMAARPENGNWKMVPMLLGVDFHNNAWVTRQGEVFLLGELADIGFVGARGMTVKNSD